MSWIIYNTSTGGVISKHATEPTIGTGESKVDITGIYTLPDENLFIFKWDGSTIVRNNAIWVKYDATTEVLISLHAENPTTGAGESKVNVDHIFNLMQPLNFWKWDGSNIVENTDITQAPVIEEGSSYEAYLFTKNGLANQNVSYEPFFIRDTFPNVSNGVDLEYTWSYNDGGNDFLSRLLIDGSTVEMQSQWEPKDTSGYGAILPRVNGGVVGSNVNTSTNQRYLAKATTILDGLTAGDTHTLTFHFASTSWNDEAAIYQAFLGVRKINNSNI